MQEHDLDLPVTPEITYHEFLGIKEVKELLIMNPTMQLQDVTPEGMPDWFSDEEFLQRQKSNFVDSLDAVVYNEDELDT